MLDRRRSADYDCAAYVAELWERITGDDIRDVLGGFRVTQCDPALASHPRRYFARIRAPIDPCLVLLGRGKSMLHVGVYLRGRVQHLAHNAPIRQPLDIAALGYHTVRLYAPRSTDS